MNMEIEVGVDIIENDRFSDDVLSNNHFMNKYFTEQERNYCFLQHFPEKHFAARFAGKEAVIKAFYGFGVECSIDNVEIIKNDNGLPIVLIHDANIDLENYDIKISLSHDENNSIAFVIIYKI